MSDNVKNSESGAGSENAVQKYFSSLKRFVCCRTVALGDQARGYVLLARSLPSARDGFSFPGTAWVEDTDGKYQPGDVFPLPDEPSPAPATETTPAR